MPTRSVKSVTMKDVSDEEEECYISDDEDDYDEMQSNSSDNNDNDLVEEAGEPSTSSRGHGYQILDRDDITKMQASAVETVVNIWGCKTSVAKTLLMHFRWDKETLLSMLAEQDPEKVYRQAGVALDEQQQPAGCSGSDSINCQTCFCEVPRRECTAMDCGHIFCNHCWTQHCKTQIADGQAKGLRCMAYKCGVLCEEDKVCQLLKDDRDALEKYQQARLMSFVEDNARVCFCPSVPWCGKVVQVEGDHYVEPECSCGKVFCFKCGKAPHSPCTCGMWDKWDEKISGDSETKNWLMANTKPCPKCSKPVEKNGGCNHVVCKCGQSFCWLCGAATGMAHSYQRIEGHSCGRWKEEMDDKIRSAELNHKRYMHYFERFKMHGDSYNKEGANRALLLKQIQDKVETGTEECDYNWLVNAMDQLKVARGVLANSYAFAYFFFGGEMYKDDFSVEDNKRNKDLFENQQQMLAEEVERLSDLVQKCTLALDVKPLAAGEPSSSAAEPGSSAPEQRVKVINSTVSIEARIVKFYEMIENDLYGRLQTCSAQVAVYHPKKLIV